MVNPDKFEEANARAEEKRASGPTAVRAHYDGRVCQIVVVLNTGVEFRFPAKAAQGLENAQPKDLGQIEITPSGLGLYFPLLDADLFLPSLLDGILGSRRWMASRLGAEGGKVRSVDKAKASRANGKLGGRPRKVSSHHR